MTERMSDERLAELEAFIEQRSMPPRDYPSVGIGVSIDLLAALRAERATVERLTKVAEQARDAIEIHIETNDDVDYIAWKVARDTSERFRLETMDSLLYEAEPVDASSYPDLAAYLREKENT